MAKNDITGKRYGKLTALYPTEKKKGKHRIWCFRCDCGNIIERTVHHLNNFSACEICNPPYSSLRKNYTGQRFGRLVALECTNQYDGKELVWRLQCDCGKVIELGVSRFIGGHTRSCGCLRKDTAAQNNPLLEDLTGRKFGELTVISLEPERENRCRKWLCKCSCGKKLIVGTSALTEGRKRSCGCVDARLFCVFKHVAPDGRIYVGNTSRLPRKAWYEGNRYHSQAAFHQAIVEHGGDDTFRTSFKHFYLTKDNAWKEYEGSEPFSRTNVFTANEAERLKRHFIKEYNATDPRFGLNAASGGKKDFNYSYEAKKRQSDTRTGKDGRTDWRVYIHENKINHKKYVGVTCRDPRIRWANGKGYHKPAKQGKADSHFAHAIQKYGWDGFEHIIVAEGLTKAQAAKKEKELIAYYETCNPEKGYNVTLGGDGTSGAHHSETTRKKLSDIAKKRIAETDVVNFKGQHHTEDTRERLRELISGRYDGENNPFAGKHHSEETKRTIARNNSQPVNQYSMQGVFIQQYRSATEASVATGISITSISYATTGNTRFAGDYLWKKTSEEFPVGVDIDPSVILGDSNHTGQRKRVRQFTSTGTFIKEYSSLKEAAEAVGANVSNISAAAYGRTKTCSGYIWRFLE